MAFTGVAIAQSNAGGNAGANAGVNAPSSMEEDLSFGSLISSLNANTSVNLSTFTDPAKIRIVKVSTLKAEGNNNPQALDEALSKNSAARTTLQTNLEGNTTIKSKLDAEAVEANDVVAVSDQNGTLIIYVDDRS